MATVALKDSKSIKVKVFYTIRGSKSTRLTSFDVNADNPEGQFDVPISLKECLWSICTSSPDMICRDHDLSIYTANFQESEKNTINKRDSLVWEGHGLMSWIMSQSNEDIQIFGKLSDAEQHIDVYIELQPTMKWIKGDFISALKTRSFDQLKTSTQTPQFLQCSCYSYKDDIQLLQKQKQKIGQSLENPVNVTESIRYLQQQASSPNSENAKLSLSSDLPSLSSASIFRPEPIFPSSASNSYYNKRQRMSPPDTYSGSKFRLNEEDEGAHRSDLTLPMPSHMVSGYTQQHSPQFSKRPDVRRSAFTIPSLSEKESQGHLQEYKGHHISSNSNSSISSTSPTSYSPSVHNMDNNNTEASSQNDFQNASNTSVPVVYAPSNKKKKKVHSFAPAGSEVPVSIPQRSNEQVHQKNSSQQINSVVRTYYEVDKDSHGNYILPVEIDSWTVVDLGTVIYDRPAYHNQRYIYPVNYTVRKWYRSMVDPKSDTQYTCRILENGREPKFEVTADDCPMTYSGPTPTTVWTIIVRRAFAIRNQEYGHNPVGPDFFGLRKNTIAKMIQDLPNASRCFQYIWQTFEPARFNKPGRNRRRVDSTLPGSLTGGVNYGLTSSRPTHNTNLIQASSRENNAKSAEEGASSNNWTSSTSHNTSPSSPKNHSEANISGSSTSSFSRKENTTTKNSPILKNSHCDSRPIETA